ncbi:MAG: lactate utilization protein C [Acidobacteriota bacterium]
MSDLDKLNLYIERARAAGAEVECIAPGDLHARLETLLAGLDPIAALPASGWPQELLETVEAVLRASNFEIVTPRKTDDGFAWDRDRLAHASVGITFCPVFLADTGSLALPAGPGAGTLAALLPEIHVALSYPEGCRMGLADYLPEIGDAMPSRLTLVTGPSRTGDIEATMTVGVHGPRKVIHYILSGR